MQSIHTNLLILALMIYCVSSYSQITVQQVIGQSSDSIYYDFESESWQYFVGLNDDFEVDTFQIELIESKNRIQYYVSLSGNKRLMQESEIKGNVFDGETKKYDPVKKELKYKVFLKDGVKHGEETIFYGWRTIYKYDQGALKCKKVINKSGEILEEGKYSSGCKIGLWKYYTDEEKPNLKLEEFYSDCNLEWRKQYMIYLEDWEK